MFIERPPMPYRLLYRKAIWRINGTGEKRIFLTFDDGPVPEVTPWVLDILDEYDVKATFFMVGDNARRYPELYREVVERGHSAGNHTMHHIRGMKTSLSDYMDDVAEASRYIESTLFRPPHGLMRLSQYRRLREKYRIVMHDLVTRDYCRKIGPAQVVENIRRLTRNGSIIVFHDSVKAYDNLRGALPASIEWLLSNGYEFGTFHLA